MLKHLSQSPTDPDFVQDPYPFLERARSAGDLVFWDDYGMPVATSYEAVTTIFKDRRLGREAPEGFGPQIPPHLAPFYAVEAHSMLELDPPRHTKLRRLVLSAFTSRRIKALAPEISALCHQLIDDFPKGEVELLSAFATKLPVIIIARLLGVPESRADDLLAWSNAMVGMYQAGRTREDEDRAVRATEAFVEFLTSYIKEKRQHPADDLITHLIAAEEYGETLSTDELISTCILLLNAGHEATVHTIGNGVKTLLETRSTITEANAQTVTEEILRFDPPLHMFTRWVKEDLTLFGQDFKRGEQVACLLGAANRDPDRWDAPDAFDPTRPIQTNAAFGAGVHFCVGAPLARLELEIALPILMQRCPGMRFAEQPRYADIYHFHGLRDLKVLI